MSPSAVEGSTTVTWSTDPEAHSTEPEAQRTSRITVERAEQRGPRHGFGHPSRLWFVGCTHAVFCPTAFLAPPLELAPVSIQFSILREKREQNFRCNGSDAGLAGLRALVTREQRQLFPVLNYMNRDKNRPAFLFSCVPFDRCPGLTCPTFCNVPPILDRAGPDGFRQSPKQADSSAIFHIQMPSDQQSGEISTSQKRRAGAAPRCKMIRYHYMIKLTSTRMPIATDNQGWRCDEEVRPLEVLIGCAQGFDSHRTTNPRALACCITR